MLKKSKLAKLEDNVDSACKFLNINFNCYNTE